MRSFLLIFICLPMVYVNAQVIDSLAHFGLVEKMVNLKGVDVVSPYKESAKTSNLPSMTSEVTKKELEANHVDNIKGLTNIVPNFFIPDYGSRLTSAIYIRGIGSRMNTPAVGLYVDNIPYVDKSAFDFNFYDIERVDVMRGPQGTLYGRNAMGGIIKVYTRNPFVYQGTDVKLGFATKNNSHNIAVTHYHHINDKLAFSAGGYYNGSRGFFKNDITGKRVDDEKAGGGRARLIYLASEQVKLDFNLSYDYSDEGAYPYFYKGGLTDKEDYPELIGKISANRKCGYRRGVMNVGLNLQWNTDKFMMNAVTGFQNLNDNMFLDQDFIQPDIYSMEQKQKINTISEELVFKNKNNKAFWEWVCGANFMYQWLRTDAPVTFFNDGVKWLGNTINSYMPDLSKMGMSMNLNLKDKDLSMGGTFQTPTMNVALFHQSTLHLTDKLSTIIGLRLDYDHNSMTCYAPAKINYDFSMTSTRMPLTFNDVCSKVLYDDVIKRDYLQVLPKLAFKYDFNKKGRDEKNIYVSVAKGMRSGGYNIQMFSDILQSAMQSCMMSDIKNGVTEEFDKPQYVGMPPRVKDMIKNQIPSRDLPDISETTYEPEFSWNYELGSHLSFLDKSFIVDAAVFYTKTRNQQIARFSTNGLGRMMVNAGKSTSCGTELSMTWTPNKHISLMGNYGYTHSMFKDYDEGKQDKENIDYTGNHVPFVPSHTMNIDAAYSFFFNSWVKSVTIGANLSGAGRIYWTEKNDVSQSFYNQLGACCAVDMGKVLVQFWGRNLTNTRYNTFYFESMNRGFEQHGKPLQLGVDIKLKL